jgi:hypothetical protein
MACLPLATLEDREGYAMTATSQDTKPATPALRVPPEEKYWRRYSPHGEAPLSLAGSVALHILVGGLLLFLGVYAASWLGGRKGSVPVEPVRLGAGKGVPGGKDGGGLKDDFGKEDDPLPGLNDGPPVPKLDKVQRQEIEKRFDPDTARRIQQNEANLAFGRLDAATRGKIRPRGDGPGFGDGKDAGKDRGKDGGGKTDLTPREKRMLRWHMRFTANTGPEYLAQLRALGAILAFPTKEGYQIVRGLRPGARANVEDISTIQRIYWIDDKPFSVRDILSSLNLPTDPLPPRFIAFMPEELEKKLFEMEKRYVTNTLRQPWNEDRLDETHFRVVPDGRGYRPELVSVSMK